MVIQQLEMLERGAPTLRANGIDVSEDAIAGLRREVLGFDAMIAEDDGGANATAARPAPAGVPAGEARRSPAPMSNLTDGELRALRNLADKRNGNVTAFLNIADAQHLTELGLAARSHQGWDITPAGTAHLVSAGAPPPDQGQVSFLRQVDDDTAD